MTEADIPLRDQIARIIESTNGGIKDGELINRWTRAADALLAAFDIRPRGSLPVNEEP